jgi:HAD superfamily hydrolase (TIGR01509 family)
LLRDRFGLTRWIKTWMISGDTGVRKPDAPAFVKLLNELGASADVVLFVDDRAVNVAAAAKWA